MTFKVTAFEFSIRFGLTTSWDVNLFLHPKGSELWFAYSTFILETPLITLNTNNEDGTDTNKT